MNFPSALTLHDVRCFEGEQRGNLRPITLLVGENSTGKSTFLGCYSVLHRMFTGGLGFEERLDFNVEPFSMGSFRDVARTRRGRSGRINQFKLGLTFSSSDRVRRPSYQLVTTFVEQGSQPVVSSLRFQFDADTYLELRQSEVERTTLTVPQFEAEVDLPIGHAMQYLDFETRRRRWRQHRMADDIREEFQAISNCLDHLFANRAPFHIQLPRLLDLIPVAPLRSKPKRTYDPVRETASPEGEDIPMLMMRLDRTEKSQWTSLHDSLIEFGRESGLFSDIKIKRHGNQMSDPFQLQVKVRSGQHANIMDVGYGVSQSLPIIVNVLTVRERRRRRQDNASVFLLQQPEVHLHPRGQAELANLFIGSLKKIGNRFLIETHSDYIIDRIRISVKKGVLDADSVSILYFEPTGNNVNIHNMTLDQNGNLEGAPEGYRDFFLKETDQLLGFES